MYLIGLDLGTSYWKAVLYDLSGKPVSYHSLRAPVHQGSHFQYFDAGELWEAVVVLLKKVTSGVKNQDAIRGISVASMAESVVPVEKNGRAGFPVIAWYDDCTSEQERFVEKRIGREEIEKVTGLYLKHIFSANKILWIKQKEPAVYAKTHKFLCISDYIVYRLTGEFFTDYSMASRTMLLDIRKREWSGELLAKTGIDPNKLPALRQSGLPAGRVLESAAKATGLSRKTMVSPGGHDHVCAAFAAGVVSEGRILDSIGTVESIFTVSGKPLTGGSKVKSGFSCGCHVEKDKYYLMGGIYTSGAAVEWLAGMLGFGEKTSKAEKMDCIENLLKAAPGKDRKTDVFFLPYLRGSGPPDVDYARKGAIYGLSLSHTAGDLMRAAVYGLSCESKKMATAITALTGRPVERYAVVGSLSGIGYWMQAKANFLNREVEAVNVPEAGTLGAAMLAGLGAKVYGSTAVMRKKIKYGRKIFSPEKKSSKWFEAYYKRYRHLSKSSAGA